MASGAKVGHVRLGTLPKTRKWRQVIELLEGGADAEAVARASSDAAESALARAANDPALVQTFWLLTQIPLAARKEHFAPELRRLGLQVGDQPLLLDIVSALTDAVDRQAMAVGRRSDLGEMAQLSASETLAMLPGRDLPGLFGASGNDAKLAIGKYAATRQFGALAREFFARLTKRHLDYYVSRELSNHVGPGERFSTLRDHGAFDAALDVHCREASSIVQDFAGGWFSKRTFGGTLTPQETGRFIRVALKKIQSELRRRRGDGG
jgi:hypothetical protein